MNDIKKEDEIYCPECGKPIKRNAVICIYCGIQIKELNTSPKVQKNIIFNPYEKSKTIALVLAIFLGFWSWLYTYKKDFKKFWIYLGLIGTGAIGVGILINLVSSGYSSPALADPGILIWLYFLINASSYIWALCNSIGRNNSFYLNYPNS